MQRPLGLNSFDIMLWLHLVRNVCKKGLMMVVVDVTFPRSSIVTRSQNLGFYLATHRCHLTRMHNPEGS